MDGVNYQDQLDICKRQARLVQITDGLSKTVLAFEQAGKPTNYVRGKEPQVTQRHWGAYHSWPLAGGGVGGALHDATINISNVGRIYSFHPKGVVMARFDGSVHFVADDTDPKTVAASLVRADVSR